MAHLLKNSTRLNYNDDLIVYLNNKLNEGFISLKTAFEYIDPGNFKILDSFFIKVKLFFFKFCFLFI